MILLFDIGNSNICIATSDGTNIISKIRVKTDCEKMPDDYFQLLKTNFPISKVSSIIIASVVPSLLQVIKIMCRKHFKITPMIIAPGIKTGVKVNTDNPSEVGADLICDSAYLTQNSPSGIIIDLGTCNKYIVIQNRELLGVLISPGAILGLKSLSRGTALLPDIPFMQPTKLLGTNTIEAIQSGIWYNLIGEITYNVTAIKNELHAPELPVFITGGVANVLQASLPSEFNFVTDLTLLGLLAIYNKNKKE